MNCGITRWKMMFAKSGRSVALRALGSSHGLVPRASPMKFATVAGVSFSSSSAVMDPMEVLMVAYSPGSSLAVSSVDGGGVCATNVAARIRARRSMSLVCSRTYASQQARGDGRVRCIQTLTREHTRDGSPQDHQVHS